MYRNRHGYWYPRARILFADIPKTASRSLLSWLRRRTGEEGEVVRSLPLDVETSFSVLRNPYGRAMSIWWSACTREDRYGWHAWGRSSPTAMVEGLIEGRGKNIDLGFSMAEITAERTLPEEHRWLRYEHLDEDVAALCGISVDEVEMPVLNRKKDMRPPAPVYSRAFVEAVNRWCPDDFALGNYCMLHPGETGR